MGNKDKNIRKIYDNTNTYSFCSAVSNVLVWRRYFVKLRYIINDENVVKVNIKNSIIKYKLNIKLLYFNS